MEKSNRFNSLCYVMSKERTSYSTDRHRVIRATLQLAMSIWEGISKDKTGNMLGS